MPGFLVAKFFLFLKVQVFFVALSKQTVADLHEKKLRMVNVERSDFDLSVAIFKNVALLLINSLLLTCIPKSELFLA